MRRKTSAGVLMALALLIPAAPAAAQAEAPGFDAACQTVERKLYKDIRKLVTIDLATATDVEIRVVANQILAATKANSLPVLPRAMQKRLDGTADELRAFLKKGMLNAWTADLRISVGRTLPDAGANVEAAAQKVLDDGSIDAALAYLNGGLHTARALDCATKPTPTRPTSSPTPGATTTVPPVPPAPVPVPTSPDNTEAPGAEGGEGGGLPLTGADTGTVAGLGGVLLLLGVAGYLIGRRRRSRFVA
ncbi:LPXTG cell wall anchor domain-containing protein [Jidongwangia harbinensis]|uniref:LPXTG cell wall anchor domain-containing protein n=1 Tax=Jidongwangia harbinensis TaxID=2878561 RepID=UPI001CD949AC|nr:LPXTG cell wall anchor domain-containing protein [Jidongwangia harbinensis]MCA2212750.1 LPXTG cell wall anchor domain-containing protein [Jidongwangia harbinensis]